jgi:hypothetical protein
LRTAYFKGRNKKNEIMSSRSLRKKRRNRNLLDQRGIGTKKDGNLKKNYARLSNGKVVHVNKLD